MMSMYLCGGRYIEGKEKHPRNLKDSSRSWCLWDSLHEIKRQCHSPSKTLRGFEFIEVYFQGHVMIFRPQRLGSFISTSSLLATFPDAKKQMLHMPAAILFHECHVSGQPLQMPDIPKNWPLTLALHDPYQFDSEPNKQNFELTW